jgi:hypothetical protein
VLTVEEMFRFMFFGGSFGSALDWVSVFSFFVIGVVYLVVPVIGYRTDRRGLLIVSLYLLIAYAGLTLLQTLILYVETAGSSSHPGRRDLGESIFLPLLLLKMTLFVVSMLLFVLGLQSLRLGSNRGPTGRSARLMRDAEMDEMDETDEDRATRDLGRAQMLIDQGRRPEAAEALEQLLRDFPSSRAAITARVTLRRLRSSE